MLVDDGGNAEGRCAGKAIPAGSEDRQLSAPLCVQRQKNRLDNAASGPGMHVATLKKQTYERCLCSQA
eukprot:620722-Pelagomonas_calceolata.AAC.4